MTESQAAPSLITRALSIRQPWAWSVATGFKAIENRTWTTNYRGRIAIHAALDDSLIDPVSSFLFGLHPAIFAADDIEYDGPDGSPILRPFTLGAIIGTVEIIGCLEYDPEETFFDEVRKLPGYHAATSDVPQHHFAEGPYCWILANPERLRDPVPVRGKLNLWEIPKQVQIALNHSRKHLLTDPSTPPNLTEAEKAIEQEFIKSQS